MRGHPTLIVPLLRSNIEPSYAYRIPIRSVTICLHLYRTCGPISIITAKVVELQAGSRCVIVCRGSIRIFFQTRTFLIFVSFSICDLHRGLGRLKQPGFLKAPTPFPLPSPSYASPSSLSSLTTFSSYHDSSVTNLSPILTLHTIHVFGALTVSILPDSQPLNSPNSVFA
jgi:hypothetical protein